MSNLYIGLAKPMRPRERVEQEDSVLARFTRYSLKLGNQPSGSTCFLKYSGYQSVTYVSSTSTINKHILKELLKFAQPSGITYREYS